MGPRIIASPASRFRSASVTDTRSRGVIAGTNYALPTKEITACAEVAADARADTPADLSAGPGDVHFISISCLSAPLPSRRCAAPFA